MAYLVCGMLLKLNHRACFPPSTQVVLEAHPREWSHPQPAYTWVGEEEAAALRPFLRGVACNVMFDLCNIPGGDRYMSLVSTSLDVEDLRLAYR